MRICLIVIATSFITSAVSYGQTQAEMNKLASDRYNKAAHEMDSIYQRIIDKYSVDKAFLKALKKSQTSWITFRASELNMKYPVREPGYYGSIHSMCISMYMEELTKTRVEHLKLWLTGIDDGDACAGTIRSPGELEDN
jgi:uncharacterized protein YecT (DUF1311 family)